MKVCVICREHPTLHFNGGLSIAAWNTARAAHDAGIDVTFVTARYPDGQDQDANSIVEIEMDGIHVVCLPSGDHADYSKWHPAVWEWWCQKGQSQDWDLLHCHGYSGSPIAILRDQASVPMIFHDHGSKEGYVQTLITDAVVRTGFTATFWEQLKQFHINVYNGSPGPAFEPDIRHMRRYERIIATSHISEMDFRTRYWLTNVELFYHPIYLLKKYDDLCVDDVKRTRPVVAVFAGDLDNPWKCGSIWLKKLLPLKDEIHLLLIGKGEATAAYAAKEFSSSYATGHLEEKYALACLRKADVLYEPSIHHIGLNLTGISAIGLGVPVVAFPTAGHTDLIGNNVAGIVVDPCDPGSVPKAVRHVIRNRPKYSEGARRRFCDVFHPKVASGNIKAIYEEVVHEHRSGGVS